MVDLQQQAATTEIATLERAVRNGQQANSPSLLFRYIQLIEEHAQYSPTLKMPLYTRLLDVLLDTMCDVLIPFHWRKHCLNYCYKPLFLMDALAKTADDQHYVRTQFKRLQTLSHYFCPNYVAHCHELNCHLAPVEHR